MARSHSGKQEGIILGVIPARGSSKRVPRKNIKMLGDKPLIAWTIEAANNAKTLDDFLVSTDDKDIAKISNEICYKLGTRTPFRRPAELSVDCDSTLVMQHALNWYERHNKQKVAYVVTLQPTSPLRSSDDIDNCVNIAKATNVESVVTVAKVVQHPYWMFVQKPFGHELEPYTYDIKLEGDMLVSQNLPLILYPNGAVYVTRRDVLMNGRLFGDRIYGYTMPRERSIDLEEELDFIVASALIPKLQENGMLAKITWVRD